jgi:hypothetical protein
MGTLGLVGANGVDVVAGVFNVIGVGAEFTGCGWLKVVAGLLL